MSTATDVGQNPPVPGAPAIATTANDRDPAADTCQLSEQWIEALEATGMAADELKQQIGPEAFELVKQCVEDTQNGERDALDALVMAEICRHLAGLGSAMWLTWPRVLSCV